LNVPLRRSGSRHRITGRRHGDDGSGRAFLEERTEGGSPWAWKRGYWPSFGCAAITWARSRQVDIPFKDPHGKLFRAKLPDTAEMLLLFVAIDVVVRWLRGRRGGATLWSTVSTRWTPYRIVMILAGLLAYFVVYVSYRNLKSWDVLLTPRDAMLLRWDRWLFFGHSPAVLLDLLGEDLAARMLTDLYESFGWTSPSGRPCVHPDHATGLCLRGRGDVGWIRRRLATGSSSAPSTRRPVSSPDSPVLDPDDAGDVRRAAVHLLAHPHAVTFAQILRSPASTAPDLPGLADGALRASSCRGGLRVPVRTVLATISRWHFAVDDVAGSSPGRRSSWASSRSCRTP
jgi:hypothetical protein